MDTKNIINSLNDLVEYLHDSHNGYKESAAEISDINLKKLFNHFSEKRQPMITVLEQEITKLGGSAVDSGSVIGAAHRVFIDLKSLITGGDREAIINEVNRGETTLRDKYRKILKESQLPNHLQTLLRQQLSEIENSLAEINRFNVPENA